MNNTNLAYEFQEDTPREELINGKVVLMSPRPVVNHNRISERINFIFQKFLLGKPCVPFGDGTELYLTEKDRFVPDGMIVCDRDKIKWNGVYGAPDLVVEVLSPGTARYDRGHKKAVYERRGVREYWIVSPQEKSIEQYLLREGKLELEMIATYYPAWMLDDMDAEDRAEAEALMSFSCGIFPELTIQMEDIFGDLLF